ncbi:MAG: hypothetical protein ACKOWK_01020 [Micrococcales bacterium]
MRENRFENSLAFIAAGTIGFSILAILIVALASLFKFQIPGAIILIPIIGLPLGFVLVFVLLITAIVRKARENK